MLPTGITIRAARPDDAEVIATFNERMAEETEGRRLDPATIRAGVRRILSDPQTGQYYLAECDGAIAGLKRFCTITTSVEVTFEP